MDTNKPPEVNAVNRMITCKLALQKPYTQVGKVAQHLLKRGTITQVEAHELYRVYRLASRIHDLVAAGVIINRIDRVDLTGTRYTTYILP